MKMIPRKDLIAMLDKGMDCELLSEDQVKGLFTKYGDAYFKTNMSWGADWELTTVNEERKKLMEEL